MRSMTRAQGRTFGLVTPSLSQPWLAAMLCVLAELVLNAVSVLRMIAGLLSRECHTNVEPADLPERTGGLMEKQTAAGSSETPKALILRRPKAVSKDEGVSPAVGA